MSQQPEPNPHPVPPTSLEKPRLAAGSDLQKPAASGPASNAAPLTPEEQMALYEKALKEDDWGHQPC